jgi:hypothetical protein
MKTVKWLLLGLALTANFGRSEDWRKIAFIGNANVKSISGVVEVIKGNEERVLHERETANVGETLRIWRGAEVVLQMKTSKSLVRAKGPVLLRLAAEHEGFDHSSVTGEGPKTGFIVRAVHGHGKYQDGDYWRDLRAGMCLPEGTRVRPFHGSSLDFYNPATRTVCRVTDPWKQTTLVSKARATEETSPTILAAQNP